MKALKFNFHKQPPGFLPSQLLSLRIFGGFFSTDEKRWEDKMSGVEESQHDCKLSPE